MSKASTSVAVHPAIARYAPKSVTQVANTVLNPLAERQVAMLCSRPRSMRRIPAGQVSEVLREIRDVNVIAALIKTGDNRKITRKCLESHPLYERAQMRIIEREDKWAGFDLNRVLAVLDESLSRQMFNADLIRRVVAWCRSLQGEAKMVAYQRIYTYDESCRTAIPDLPADVVCGRVEELTLHDLGLTTDPEKPFSFKRIRNHSMNDTVARYDILDLPLARMCAENDVKPPLTSVDSIDDDAFTYLLANGSASMLMEQGLLDDPRRLLPYIDNFDTRLRVQLAFKILDTDVISALVEGITYGKRAYVDLFVLLNSAPGFDHETRMTLLSYASPSELRDYLNGTTLNQPEPGDGTRIVDSVLDPEGMRWCVNGSSGLAFAIGNCAPTAAALEAVNRLIDIQCGELNVLFDNHGLVGRVAVERITKILGDDSTKWEMLLRLHPDWSGNLDDLIATAAIL